MPAIVFTEASVLLDGITGDIAAPRNFIKKDLEGYATTYGYIEEEPTITTTVRYNKVTQTIVCDNNPLTVVATNCTGLDAAYDQVDRLWIAYIKDGELFLYWYDTALPGFTTTSYGLVRQCMLFMDDVRYFVNADTNNFIVLMYIQDGQIKYRTELERFLTEYILTDVEDAQYMKSAGMNMKWRLQVAIGGASLSSLTGIGDDAVYNMEIAGKQVVIKQSMVIGVYQE